MSETKHTLSWQADTIPRSSLFDDTFYSRDNGQVETTYVFIDGNRLPQRWNSLEHMTVGELGFGTGLNFLETWRRWIDVRSPSQRLVFTSFEAYPISADDMARAHMPWKTLKPLSDILVSKWRKPSTSPVPWEMDKQTVLRVIPGMAEETVTGWSGLADAWYLDGFSPAKNPDMWGSALMQQVFDHTVETGSFATYTAAAWVRRNLEGAGFTVSKRKGFAGKREMLLGQK